MATEPIPLKPRRSLETHGLGWRYTVGQHNLVLDFSYVKAGDEPTAEVAATADLPGLPMHQLRTRLRLLGSNSKRDFAKALWERTKLLDPAQWTNIVESACEAVLEKLRAGSPIHEIDGDFEAPPADTFLVAPLIHTGAATELYGPGGAGKGYLACGLAVSLGLGVPFCGLPTVSTRVLYLDWEDTLDEFKRRVRAIADGLGVHPRKLLYRECRQPFSTMAEDLASYVAAEGVGLVIVDSAEAAMGDSGERSTSAARANRLYNELRYLNTSALVIDHVTGESLKSKELAGRPFDSVFKSFRARATWEVKKDQSLGASRWQVGLYLTKQNRTAPLAPIGIEIDLSTPGRVLFRRQDVRQSDVLSAATSWQFRIDGALWNAKLTHAELYALLGAESEAEQGTVRKTVSKGVQKGRYARDTDGPAARFWKPLKASGESESPI